MSSRRINFWKYFKKNKIALIGGLILLILYLGSIFAGFISPYGVNNLRTDLYFHPPNKIHFYDSEKKTISLPFIYATKLITHEYQRKYQEDRRQKIYLKFFTKGDSYKLLGFVPCRIHLFGVEEPYRIYLLGADRFGRDIFTRLLYGSQISLSIGLVGISITVTLGMIFGGLAGYYGGLVDTLLMRFCELLMSFPGLYLIMALRATVPPTVPSTYMYLLTVVVLALVYWPGRARVIRGQVLSLREQEYVIAAKACGMSDIRIILRHILPNTFSYIIVSATLAIPGYILGETILSYLNVGIQEPQSSWGLMLREAQNIAFWNQYPWILWPGFLIFITVLAFNFFGDGLRDALDPRREK